MSHTRPGFDKINVKIWDYLLRGDKPEDIVQKLVDMGWHESSARIMVYQNDDLQEKGLFPKTRIFGAPRKGC